MPTSHKGTAFYAHYLGVNSVNSNALNRNTQLKIYRTYDSYKDVPNLGVTVMMTQAVITQKLWRSWPPSPGLGNPSTVSQTQVFLWRNSCSRFHKTLHNCVSPLINWFINWFIVKNTLQPKAELHAIYKEKKYNIKTQAVWDKILQESTQSPLAQRLWNNYTVE